MSIAVDGMIVVQCPDCGRSREVSRRQARRQGIRCRDCTHGIQREGPTDRERRWALEHFSDEEIVELASILWGGQGSLENVRLWRATLTDYDAAQSLPPG